MYLLNLNKKQQSTYDTIEATLRNIDSGINRLTSSLELKFDDGTLEAIQPMIGIVTRLAVFIILATWLLHLLDSVLKKGGMPEWKDWIGYLGKLCVAFWLMGSMQKICLVFIDLSNNFMFALNASTSSLTIGESFLDLKEVAKALEDMKTWDLTWLRVSLVITGIIIDVTIGIMKMIAEFRMMSIAMFLVFSPLAASCAVTGISHVGKFFRGFTATCLQGGYIVGCFKLYEIFVSKEVYLDGIDGAFWMIVLYSVGVLVMVFGGKGWLEKYILP